MSFKTNTLSEFVYMWQTLPPLQLPTVFWGPYFPYYKKIITIFINIHQSYVNTYSLLGLVGSSRSQLTLGGRCQFITGLTFALWDEVGVPGDKQCRHGENMRTPCHS